MQKYMQETGTMRTAQHRKITFNSPVILTFTGICIVALIADFFTGGWTTYKFCSVYSSSWTDPFTYIRLIGHMFGHAGIEHFVGNIMLILVVGPLLEEKYGSLQMLWILLITAVTTGLAHMLLFPHIQLLGASGVVFSFILLSSFTSMKEGQIPLTFILVAVLYIGEQIYLSLVITDNISHFTHIVGGMVGAAIGMTCTPKK